MKLRELFQKTFWEKEALGLKKKKLFVLLITLPIPFIVSLVAFFLGVRSTVIIMLFALGIILVAMPYLIFNFLEFEEIKKAEDNFPGFLRDLAQAVSAGMTIPQAVDTCAKTKYNVLSRYIDKLDIWLSWDMPFPKAWERFTKTLSKSALIKRVNNIILEAYHTGGDIKSTLGALSENVNIMKELESEKKSIMHQQIIVMYLIFFIFLGVIVGVYKILAPIIFIQKLGVFSGISIQGSEGGQMSIDYFKNLFLMMVIVESICAGLIAGEISEETMISGVKHIVIMFAAGIFIFSIFVIPTQLNLETSLYPPSVNPGGKININGKVFFESSAAVGATIELLAPNGETHKLFADNVGEFKDVIEAPMTAGKYNLVITATYKEETEVSTEEITVK